MTGQQDILFNITGQSLVFDCPEGRPSSVTSATVYNAGDGDDGTAESTTTGAAAVETNPDTTLDAAAGVSQADARKVPLTATTGIEIGRQYLITSATSETEWVEVIEIADADYVRVRHPLANDYAAGATFQSTRISIDVDDTWVAETNNISDDTDPNPGYRVRWVYVVDGVTRVAQTYFDLVRYAGKSDITPAMVAARVQNWFSSLPTDHREDGGQRLIDAAYDEVAFELHNAGRADEMARNKWIVEQLVIRGAEYQLNLARVRDGAPTDDRFLKTEERFYSALAKVATTTAKIPFAADTGGGGAQAAPSPAWRR